MPEERKTFEPYRDVLLKLPTEAQRLILTILANNDPMDYRTSQKLKDVCQRYSRELEALGLLADYYAYVIAYWASQQDPAAIAAAVPAVSAKDLFGRN